MTEILTLAEEMRQANAGTSSDTYSLTEMQTVGGEMGLDPSQVALAAAQYESGHRGGAKKDRWRHQFVREIPFAVNEVGWERMVDELRSLTGTMGVVRERADGSRECMSNANGETIVVMVTEGEAGSVVHLRVNRTDTSRAMKAFTAFAMFMTAMLGAAFAAKGGYTGYDLIPAFTLLTIEAIALALGLEISSTSAEKRFAALADRLEEAALSSRSPASTQARRFEEGQAANELRA
jgi:hypothetical protein